MGAMFRLNSRSNNILPKVFASSLVILYTYFIYFVTCSDIDGEKNVGNLRARRTTDYYSSQEDMRELVRLEAKILHRMTEFHRNMKKHLKLSKRLLTDIKQKIKKLVGSEEEYVTNPVASFLLLQRFHRDWGKLRKVMTDFMIEEKHKNEEAFGPKKEFPKEKDVFGAVVGLARLQEWYLLKSKDVANGVLGTVQHLTNLTARDCLEVARILQDKKPEYALKWTEETLRRNNHDDIEIEIEAHEIRARVHYYTEGPKNITSDIVSLLMTDPDYDIEGLLSDIENNPPNPHYLITIDEVNFGPKKPIHRACRGEYDLTPEESKSLRCRYHFGHPYLRIGPAKLEEALRDPPIFIYHDIVTDGEIEQYKISTRKYLSRAGVVAVTGKKVTKESRVSKNAYVDDQMPLVVRLYARIEAITGLDTRSAEILNTQNYGTGGFYDAHYDFINLGYYGENVPHALSKHKKDGDRIATMLFYLSDVQGGTTVFPYLGVNMKPKKGSAILWYNLHRNGTVDRRTLHGGCPVISGSKWVMNLLLHERGQEFRLPCKTENV